MEKREKFSSRLGFILISAGCAIGLGNVWRFPYITGKYGGAAFVLIYLVFLVILGMPIMAMEFAVGRASRKSAARSFHVLEPKGTKWHIEGSGIGYYFRKKCKKAPWRACRGAYGAEDWKPGDVRRRYLW